MNGSAFKVIENNGPNSAKSALNALCDIAEIIDVQVAFTTEPGLKAILSRLRKVAARRKVRFVTGLYQGCTEPRALSLLLRAQKQSANRFEVRLSRETSFHRKVYVARTKKTLHVIVGSSNLTTTGLMSSGELNLLISLPLHSNKADVVSAAVERAWDDAVPLTANQIKRYKKARPPAKAPTLPKSSLAWILGKKTKQSLVGAHSTGLKATPPKAWVDGMRGYVRKQTEVVVSDETSWDRKNWDWYTAGQNSFRKGDWLLMLDRSGKSSGAYLAQLMDTTRTATATPDGHHFAAFRKLARTPQRKLTPKLCLALRKMGVPKTDGARRRLRIAVWERIRALF